MSTLIVFSFFLGILFLTVHWGFRAFSLSVARADVTTEARRLSLFIEHELRGTSYFSVSTRSRTVSKDRRDAICFVSRNSWSSANAYNENKGTPNWNRYFLYYATRALPHGSLIRLSIDAGAAAPSAAYETGPFPFAGFVSSPDSYLREEPPFSPPSEVETAQILASAVKKFEVKKDPVNQNIDLRFLLRQNGFMARRASGVREGGTFELKYLIHPENTL